MRLEWEVNMNERTLMRERELKQEAVFGQAVISKRNPFSLCQSKKYVKKRKENI